LRGKRERKAKPFTNEVDLSIIRVTNSKSKSSKKSSKRKSISTTDDLTKKVRKNSRKNKSLYELEIENLSNENDPSQISNASTEAIYIHDDESWINKK
jgi:hypothetical protein